MALASAQTSPRDATPLEPRFVIEGNKGGRIELFGADCLEGMDVLHDGSIDVVVTSPPYNLGIDYGTYDDAIPREDYVRWLKDVCEKIKQKLGSEGSFFLNVGSSPSNPWGPFEIATALRSSYALQNVIHWVKSIYVENESYGSKQSMNVGHYKPINSTRFVNDTHEYVFHFTKSGRVPLDRLSIGVPYKDRGNVGRWKEGAAGVRCRGNTWYIPYRTIQSRADERPHPASFPPELAEMCLRLHGVGKRAPRVLDPFMGIGNTALACLRLGLDCVGFEIDEDYCSASARMLQAAGGRYQSVSRLD